MTWQRSIGSTIVLGALALVATLVLGTSNEVRSVGPTPCAFPDGMEYNGECCDPGAPRLPQFPPVKLQDIRYFTWNRCSLARNKPLCVQIGTPQLLPGECSMFFIPFDMRTCGAQAISLLSGSLFAAYARTFVEAPTNGGDPETQVWRFLINGDLEASQFLLDRFGDNPHIPQCYRDYENKIHWFGYLDYRQDCADQSWSVEWVLDHDCDLYHHNKSSARPGVYHPTRSFNMAGPSTFTPSTTLVPPIDGIFQADADGLRQVDYSSGSSVCYRDDPLKGQLDTIDDTCPCDSKGQPQYGLTAILGSSLCGTSVSNQKSGKVLARKRVGHFDDPPGDPKRAVNLVMGDVLWSDACTGLDTSEYFEGVEVINPEVENFAFAADGTLVPLSPFFFDVGSSNDSSCVLLKGAPHISCKFITDNLAFE